MRKKVMGMLVALLIISPSLEVMAAGSFKDVKKKDWYYSDVMKLAGDGGINGYEDGTFKPDNYISFGEFLSLSMKSVTGESYPSQSGAHWVSGVYNAALRKGIIDVKDYPPKQATYDKRLTREEMASIIININELIQGEAAVGDTGGEALVPDLKSADKKHQKHIVESFKKGLITGKAKGFDPKGLSTRAEAVSVVMRLLDSDRRVTKTPY